MANASDVFAVAKARLLGFVEEVIGERLQEEWSEAANALYKEQFAKKQNPYGEPWTPRPGDDKRTKSYYKFGRVVDVEGDGFSLAVAGPNPKRSCVPFEPRSLGAWKPRFQDILDKRMHLLFRNVRP